jgi:hypothetical protein
MCRYFVIVDDIWSTQAWELVKSALPENNLNSRIITTTRIINVATSCCSSLEGYVHNIQPLSNQHSQNYFLRGFLAIPLRALLTWKKYLMESLESAMVCH